MKITTLHRPPPQKHPTCLPHVNLTSIDRSSGVKSLRACQKSLMCGCSFLHPEYSVTACNRVSHKCVFDSLASFHWACRGGRSSYLDRNSMMMQTRCSAYTFAWCKTKNDTILKLLGVANAVYVCTVVPCTCEQRQKQQTQVGSAPTSSRSMSTSGFPHTMHSTSSQLNIPSTWSYSKHPVEGSKNDQITYCNRGCSHLTR